MTTTRLSTTCSGCWADITLDLFTGMAEATRPSNGRRGSLHQPARLMTTEIYGTLEVPMWDCPLCGYADSLDRTL